jgi:CRP/FNR family transcriptional regulator
LADDKKTQTLRLSPIFSSLSDDELGGLAGLAIERSFQSEESIFREGDNPDYFYIIVSGGIKVIKYPSSGREFIIAFFGPGEMFGEVAVFEDKPYPASAVTTSETRVIGIQGENLLSFLSSHPRVALKIINVLGGRLRDAQSRLRDLAGERVEQRLAAILMMLVSKIGNTLPFTRQEIADMAGTTTETAIRILSQLRNRKIISSTRGKITILDETKLRILSEGPPHV